MLAKRYIKCNSEEQPRTTIGTTTTTIYQGLK